MQNIQLTARCLIVVMLVSLTGCVPNQHLRDDGAYALRINDPIMARDKYARAVERRPSDYRAQIGLAKAYLMLGQPLDAQLSLEKALVVRPEHPELTPEVLDLLAEAIYLQDRPEVLFAFLEETATYYGQSRDYLRQADYLIRLGDLDGAMLAMRKAAFFAEVDDAEPYMVMANFYDSINDQPKAIQALKYAYWVDPEYPGIEDRFRQYGIVPGPTLKQEPPKPEILQ